MNETERMKELVKKLNEAAKAYYQEDREIMSNLEYDTLYDELQVLEEKTGVTLAGSPTTKVGYEAMDELPKEAHESPMLSLDKTKDVEVLRSFIGDHKTEFTHKGKRCTTRDLRYRLYVFLWCRPYPVRIFLKKLTMYNPLRKK